MSKTQFSPYGQFRVALDEGDGKFTLEYLGPPPSSEEQAWRISFNKWLQVIRYVSDPDSDYPFSEGGIDSCGLCMLYWDEGGCTDCPVKQYTGFSTCSGTPYQPFAIVKRHSMRISDIVNAARAELNFLYLVQFWWEQRSLASKKERGWVGGPLFSKSHRWPAPKRMRDLVVDRADTDSRYITFYADDDDFKQIKTFKNWDEHRGRYA
jgi:hypothetical protein